MKFSQTAILGTFLATVALAAPKGQNGGLLKRIQRRTTNSHKSAPMKASTAEINSTSTSTANVQYSNNWSGAVITTPPTGQTFNAVYGTFTVPTPSSPNGSGTSQTYSASAWVGIDGDTYSNAILQTGIDFTVSSSGGVSYDAWYEWYPDYAYDFNLDVSAGDVISLAVVATSGTTGTATIENQATGDTVTVDLSSAYGLGGENAEWIVEDYDQGGEEVAFANFGTVTFTGASAATAQSSEDASSATIILIQENGQVLTSASVSGSTVSISYI